MRTPDTAKIPTAAMIPTILLPPVDYLFYLFCWPDQCSDLRLFLSDKKITLFWLIVKWFFCMSDIINTNTHSLSARMMM